VRLEKMPLANPIKPLLAAGILLQALLPARGQDSTNIVWNTGLGKSGAIESSAAIAPDGTIYITSFDAKLHALDPKGAVKWSFATGSDIRSSPAVGTDGTVYFGSRDRKFYAVTPAGRERWSFTTGAWVDSSPAIGADGTLYFGGWDKQFYALDPSGRKKWQFATGAVVDSSPAIAADGTIYFGSHDRLFYALNPDGTRKWSFETGGPIISSPAIAGDGTVYFTSVDGNFYALTADGTKKWQLHTGGTRASSPVIGMDGRICLGVSNCLWGINTDGTRWRDFCVGDVDGTAAMTVDGCAVFDSRYGAIYGWHVEDTPRWSLMLGGGLPAPPTVAPDGTVYVGSGPRLYALKGTQGLGASSWPKFRCNLRQTGRVGDGLPAGR
jgi:outer membrane protein assembly factor BamB